MLSLLITILVMVIIAGLIYGLLSLFPANVLPQPFRNIILGLMIIIMIIYLLGIAFGFAGWHGVQIR